MMSNDMYLFPFQLCLGGLASCFEDVTEEMPEGPFDIILSRYAVAQFNWIQLAIEIYRKISSTFINHSSRSHSGLAQVLVLTRLNPFVFCGHTPCNWTRATGAALAASQGMSLFAKPAALYCLGRHGAETATRRFSGDWRKGALYCKICRVFLWSAFGKIV